MQHMENEDYIPKISEQLQEIQDQQPSLFDLYAMAAMQGMLAGMYASRKFADFGTVIRNSFDVAERMIKYKEGRRTNDPTL